MSKILNFIVGAIAGALVASAVATLLAPYSGNELQDKVKEYTQNLKDEVQKAPRSPPCRIGKAGWPRCASPRRSLFLPIKCSSNIG